MKKLAAGQHWDATVREVVGPQLLMFGLVRPHDEHRLATLWAPGDVLSAVVEYPMAAFFVRTDGFFTWINSECRDDDRLDAYVAQTWESVKQAGDALTFIENMKKQATRFSVHKSKN